MERELKRIEVKYLNAMNELYKTLKTNSDVSINMFLRSQNVSRNLSRVMQNMNLIRCKKVGNNAHWFWIGEKPNSKMAMQVTINTQIDREKMTRSQQPKVEVKPIERPILAPRPNPTPTPPPSRKIREDNTNQLRIDYDVTSKVEKESVNVSILWGLFTYIKK